MVGMCLITGREIYADMGKVKGEIRCGSLLNLTMNLHEAQEHRARTHIPFLALPKNVR